ncbi:hypothetical protein PsorP6_009347 [Peronosclerospora sorghi]|uniref:Uncharacterized protein n=1 Tax=Peronosclerospora sorghi TaxID=230839 RepID=A0ACC0W0J9_9STRA|nr:hypothetical protein PsorP6_009347 [Peronosclerospora sorghi]
MSPIEDVAWANILANQHQEFDNLHMVEAARSTALFRTCKETQGLLPSDELFMEELAVMTALSGGMDMILVEEHLPATSALAFTNKFSSNQLKQIATLARPPLP